MKRRSVWKLWRGRRTTRCRLPRRSSTRRTLSPARNSASSGIGAGYSTAGLALPADPVTRSACALGSVQPLDDLGADQPGQHHVVLGADGRRILIGGAGEGDHVPADLLEANDLVHESAPGTVRRPGLLLVESGQRVHLIDHRLQ